MFIKIPFESIIDFKTNTIKKVRIIINESKKINPKSKEVIEEIIRFIVDLLKEESANYINSKIPQLKH